MEVKRQKTRNPWAWVPSLYFAEGMPYVVVMTVSVIMYKRMGISNADIALYTSWLYLPWVIKPLWSPVVDLVKTKRWWIVSMQVLLGAAFAGVAFTIPLPGFFQYTLAFLWLLAFSSATHDIAADGFYMIGLDEHKQAFFVGIRSTFYRLAILTGQGLIVILAGYLESSTGLASASVSVKAINRVENQAMTGFQNFHIIPEAGPLHLVAGMEELEISTNVVLPAQADSILHFVKEWNTKHRFYPQEIPQTVTNSETGTEVSWWSENVSGPLGQILQKHFGPTVPVKKLEQTVGNVGVVYFHLSEKPKETPVAVNLSWKSGDKSIQLLEGSRFVFDKFNWNQPALAVIQLDPKLKKASGAVFEATSGNITFAWVTVFFILSGLLVGLFLFHRFVLPRPAGDRPAVTQDGRSPFSEFFRTFALFFKKEHIGVSIAFLLLFRFGEAQLVKLAAPFLLDAREAGGLGLTTGEVGLVYGTIGMIALTVGGILGGWVASRQGLKYWLWWMILAVNLPNGVYVFLAYALPDSFITICIAVAIEQFGYSFGFTAYMLYMIYISEGEHKTAHFAITTGFMALGMMLPGMFSGWLQELIGYQHFFIWVVVSAIPILVVAFFVKIKPEFGKKLKE
ncbi:hypothetical protein AAG747_06455 [Rapidithrix thailandica]|uniref:MFS transporter n=1 Tax=Rapidithrix thailandica TaxID=413964 RepID=A0AAW9S3N8_9BACT